MNTNPYKNLVNLEQASALLGCTVADLLFVFHKAEMPSPLFVDRDDLFDWLESNAPEITDQDELKAVYRELHSQGLEPTVYDDGERRGLLVWVDDSDGEKHDDD